MDADLVAAVPCTARGVAVSPDAGALLAVSRAGVELVDLTGAPVWARRIEVADEHPVEVQWAADGHDPVVLANRVAHALDPDTGAARRLPPGVGDRDDVTALALDTTGRLLALGTASGEVVVLDRRTAVVTRHETGGRVNALAWRPGEPALCVAVPNALQWWDLPRQAMLRSIGTTTHPVARLAWSPDGSLVAAAGTRDVFTIDTASWRGLDRRDLGGRQSPVALGFTRSGAHLLVGFGDEVAVVDRQLDLVRTLPAALREAGGLHVGGSGAVAVRATPDEVRVWRMPDTEPTPDRAATTAAVRRWAVRAARSVGRDRAVDDGVLAVRSDVLVPAGDDRWGPGFAWLDGSYVVQDADGRVVRTGDPAEEPLWAADVPAVPGGVLDVEAAGVLDVGAGGVRAVGAGGVRAVGAGGVRAVEAGGVRAVEAGGVRAVGASGRPGVEAAALVAVAFHHSEADTVLLLDAGTGQRVASVPGGQGPAWSPDGRFLAVPGPGATPDHVLVHAVRRGAPEGRPRVLPARQGVGRVAWSPDGRWLAASSGRRVVVWDSESWERVPGPAETPGRSPFGPVAWSPDGRWLAAADSGVTVWDAVTWQARRVTGAGRARGWAPALTWSPDSAMLAFPGAGAGTVALWDVTAWKVARVLPRPDGVGDVWAVRWSADDEIGVGYAGGLVLRWRLDAEVERDASPLPFDIGVLTSLGVATARAGAAVALATVADLLAVVAGRDDGRLGWLRGHAGVVALRGLRWPVAALVGVVVLLAAELPPQSGFEPPGGAFEDELAGALGAALAGASGAAPVAGALGAAAGALGAAGSVRPEVPLAALVGVLDGVDDRLLTMLGLLGPEAVAAEPLLPVRMRALREQLWALDAGQRRLLGLRLTTRAAGRAQGAGLGERAGLARHGAVNALVPTQLALPELLGLRYTRGELLYRTRQGALPPVLRSAVLVLDDSPAAHGQVGVTLRMVAHLVASALVDDHHRCAVVRTGEPGAAVFLGRAQDLTALWTGGSVRRADVGTALRTAERVADGLADPLVGPARVLVLTQEYAEVPERPSLRCIRVRYPGRVGGGGLTLRCDASAEEVLDVVVAALAG
ncbi:hypothetical protein GCM10010492_61010 [Saccharothrix mutabilis subsp. mutabilis]|uniref:Uncharacterized protein n=1 Tax=Saccharothrix mutabilis subsp. mutabilis TaxID=66855 RepID=A0ABN0UJP1_9PSEU